MDFSRRDGEGTQLARRARRGAARRKKATRKKRRSRQQLSTIVSALGGCRRLQKRRMAVGIVE